jgi:hypothetical protein
MTEDSYTGVSLVLLLVALALQVAWLANNVVKDEWLDLVVVILVALLWLYSAYELWHPTMNKERAIVGSAFVVAVLYAVIYVFGSSCKLSNKKSYRDWALGLGTLGALVGLVPALMCSGVSMTVAA